MTATAIGHREARPRRDIRNMLNYIASCNAIATDACPNPFEKEKAHGLPEVFLEEKVLG